MVMKKLDSLKLVIPSDQCSDSTLMWGLEKQRRNITIVEVNVNLTELVSRSLDLDFALFCLDVLDSE